MPAEPTSPRGKLAVLGAVLTPPGAGLSLQVWPLFGPALLFALAGLFMGYRSPRVAWRVGLWMVLGLLGATLTVAAIVAGMVIARGGSVGSGSLDFARITLLFVALPGLVGGCLGGWCGAFLARKRAGPPDPEAQGR
jgi:hypothetical protein